jgi:predicted amino acid-binding ACT domain protein
MTTTTSTDGLLEGAGSAPNPGPNLIGNCPMNNQAGTGNIEPEKKDPTAHLALNVIWLDHHHRKMGIGIMGTDRTGIIAHLTRELRDRGLNIDNGFGSLIEVAAGAFFEISGDPITMRQMFDEIIRNRHQRSPFPKEPPPTTGMIYELMIIAPDRPGIIYDLSKRLIEHRISIDQMVIRTQGSRHRGIVYSRIEMPSDEARARFLDSLRDVEGYQQWRIKCRRRNPQHRGHDTFNDTRSIMN